MSRPLNDYFKQMLAAKKDKLASFTYKGNTYVGSEHPRLGMIYKKGGAVKKTSTKKTVKKVMSKVSKKEKEALKHVKKACKLLKGGSKK